MMFDRFDICEAYYLFAYYWHDGQWSQEYEVFGRLDDLNFHPAPNLTEDKLSENGKEIYRNLMARARRGEHVVRSR